jgi:hypothetical protein
VVIIGETTNKFKIEFGKTDRKTSVGVLSKAGFFVTTAPPVLRLRMKETVCTYEVYLRTADKGCPYSLELGQKAKMPTT